TFVSATGGGMPLPGGVVTWNVGTLAASGAGSVQLGVRVKSPLPNGTLIPTGTYAIDSAETAPVSGAPVTTSVTSAPVLAIGKTGSPNPVPAGGEITHKIRFLKPGEGKAAA